MYYRISSLTNRLTNASQFAAYHPQGLRPLAKVQHTPLVMPYEAVQAPDLAFGGKESSRSYAAAASAGGKTKYAPLSPKLKALQEKFQKDDGIPVHLKGGQSDYVLYYASVVGCVVGTAWSFYEIFKMARPKKQ